MLYITSTISILQRHHSALKPTKLLCLSSYMKETEGNRLWPYHASRCTHIVLHAQIHLLRHRHRNDLYFGGGLNQFHVQLMCKLNTINRYQTLTGKAQSCITKQWSQLKCTFWLLADSLCLEFEVKLKLNNITFLAHTRRNPQTLRIANIYASQMPINA